MKFEQIAARGERGLDMKADVTLGHLRVTFLYKFLGRVFMTQEKERQEQTCPYHRLNAAIVEIFNEDSPHAYSSIAAVDRHLRQFHLSSQVEAYEIYHEAYLRGRKFIEGGGNIYNPIAWLKGTAFKIVREKSRKQRKECPSDPQSSVFDNLVSSDNHIERRLDALWEAMAKLRRDNPEMEKLIAWKLLDCLSWKEIRLRLIQELGEEAPTEEALRQKGVRAKRRLRRIYHEIEDEIGGLHQKIGD